MNHRLRVGQYELLKRKQRRNTVTRGLILYILVILTSLFLVWLLPTPAEALVLYNCPGTAEWVTSPQDCKNLEYKSSKETDK
jgi:hypothetical protein